MASKANGRAPVDFIHIGLPKCASTYLQTMWNQDPTYVRLNPTHLVTSCRQMALSGSSQSLDLGSLPPLDGQSRVVSSEGFAWCALNDPKNQVAIGALQEIAARVLGEARLTDKILIVVRNPVDWLRSCHDQSLKEGGCDSFADFLKTQRKLCESVLDLRHTLDVFRRHFSDMVVLSVDEMTGTPQDFWAKYSERLAVPVPTWSGGNSDGPQYVNRRLSDRAVLLAHLNRLGKTLGETYMGMTDYVKAVPSEVEQLRPTVTSLWKWLHRRLVEFASEDELKSIAEQLHIDDDGTFQQIFIDRDLHQWIETRYLQPLETMPTIPQAMLARYRKALDDALRAD